MKKNIKYKLYGLLLFVFAFASCETADADVSPIISSLNKPMVEITKPLTGAIVEGSTVIITIAFDQTIDRAVTFTPTVTGTADDDDYEVLEPVTLQPYTNSVEFPVHIVADYIIEDEETIIIEFEIEGIAEKYLVHPDTVLAPIELTIAVADPTLLTVNFTWDNDLDMDMVTFSDTSVYPETLWGTGGATGANPEVDHSIWLEDPVGDYYVCILDWGEGVDFNYIYTLAHPDGTVETIEGTFDATNYPYEHFVGPDAWGNPNAYKILKVVNDGTKFVVTAL